jgi:hypothetical protein
VSLGHVAISELDMASNLFSAGRYASPLLQVVNQGTLKQHRNILSRNDQVQNSILEQFNT